MRFHPDELRDQHNHAETPDSNGGMVIVAMLIISAALTIAMLAWAFWPSQVPVTCRGYIGGEIVACAEGL